MSFIRLATKFIGFLGASFLLLSCSSSASLYTNPFINASPPKTRLTWNSHVDYSHSGGCLRSSTSINFKGKIKLKVLQKHAILRLKGRHWDYIGPALFSKNRRRITTSTKVFLQWHGAADWSQNLLKLRFPMVKHNCKLLYGFADKAKSLCQNDHILEFHCRPAKRAVFYRFTKKKRFLKLLQCTRQGKDDSILKTVYSGPNIYFQPALSHRQLVNSTSIWNNTIGPPTRQFLYTK